MLKNFSLTVLIVFSFSFPGLSIASAGETAPVCMELDEKASGETVKYSLHAEVNGPVFFDDIGCGVTYRNSELCAMEMVSFDTSAKVFDYNSSEEINISQAFFWLNEKDESNKILAFSSKETAEKYNAGREGGLVLDYVSLTDRLLK